MDPALFASPQVLARVLARVDAWTPDLRGYRPEWKSSHPGNLEKAWASMLAHKEDRAKGMHAISTLLNDPAHFKAFRTTQDCNLVPAAQRPAKATCDAATGQMRAIEVQRGLKGFVTVRE